MDIGEREREYVTISKSILMIEELSLTEKIILARIAGFDQYFESKENCAKLLGISPASVQKTKTKLERLGYVYSTGDSRCAKKYTVNPKWRTSNNRLPSTTITSPQKDIPTPTTINHPKVVSSSSEPRKLATRKVKWDKRYPKLIDVRDRALQYLRNSGIPVNIEMLNCSVAQIADTFPGIDGSKLINSYIDYLESPVYLYQLEHNQYCPKIKSTNDFSEKFARIREFKNNKRQHYDPEKNLTQE